MSESNLVDPEKPLTAQRKRAETVLQSFGIGPKYRLTYVEAVNAMQIFARQEASPSDSVKASTTARNALENAISRFRKLQRYWITIPNAAKSQTVVVCLVDVERCVEELRALLPPLLSASTTAESEKEICICAAVRFSDGRIVRGHRHDACFITAAGWTPKPARSGHIQGFITSLNRFVGREEGAKLQNAAGLRSAHHGGVINEELFSEDLYFDTHDHVAWNTPYQESAASETPVPAGQTKARLAERREEARRLDVLTKMVQCEHPSRTGSNDYMLCNDCGLSWDYRCESPDAALVRYMKSNTIYVLESVASSLAPPPSPATDQEPQP